MDAKKQRHATAEEWVAIIASVPPRVARHLRSGSSFTDLDGVRIRPPHGYVAEERELVRKTTTTFVLKGEPN